MWTTRRHTNGEWRNDQRPSNHHPAEECHWVMIALPLIISPLAISMAGSGPRIPQPNKLLFIYDCRWYMGFGIYLWKGECALHYSSATRGYYNVFHPYHRLHAPDKWMASLANGPM